MNESVVNRERTSLIGDAGEHLVVAELLRRGWLAALAPRNATAFDVLAERSGRVLRIRVKTMSAASRTWCWNLKRDAQHFRDLRRDGLDRIVLVRFPAEGPASFWIGPTDVLDDLLCRSREVYLAGRRKDGTPHPADNRMVRVGPELLPPTWADAWASLDE
jgi:hypothetical protein